MFWVTTTEIVRLVGLFVKTEHFVAVKAVEFRGSPLKKCVAEYFLGRIIVLLVVKSVNASEIGNTAFSAHSRSAEKYNSLAVVNYVLKLFNCAHGNLLF